MTHLRLKNHFPVFWHEIQPPRHSSQKLRWNWEQSESRTWPHFGRIGFQLSHGILDLFLSVTLSIDIETYCRPSGITSPPLYDSGEATLQSRRIGSPLAHKKTRIENNCVAHYRNGCFVPLQVNFSHPCRLIHGHKKSCSPFSLAIWF